MIRATRKPTPPTSVCHGVADDIAQTGVLQHVAQHAAEDADEDDPAKVNAQHGSHQYGARRGRDERVADSQIGQQGNDVVQHRALGALCQRESQRDEDDQTGVKEHRHGHDKTRDAQCPCGFFIAELPHHWFLCKPALGGRKPSTAMPIRASFCCRTGACRSLSQLLFSHQPEAKV